jgi:hypothetical protein
MTTAFLERFYESIILPKYQGSLDLEAIKWISHGKVDLDAFAHYFECGGVEFVLLYEDYPDGSFLKDGLSHNVIRIGKETSVELRFGDESSTIPNIIGWFTLYKEIQK